MGVVVWVLAAMGEGLGVKALEVEGLGYQYLGASRAALEAVSFSIDVGERVALLGPNGAGKSTLLLCLAGVLKAKVGTVRGGRVGLVFQDADDQLFMPTVFDDVAFGPLNMGLAQAEVVRRVTESLAAVGCAGYEERLPQQLSGGEKRRVAIATALAMQPEVLLLDEPSTHLDRRGKKALVELLERLEVACLVSTHDLWLAEALCARSLVLEGGMLRAVLATKQLLSDEKMLEDVGL